MREMKWATSTVDRSVGLCSVLGQRGTGNIIHYLMLDAEICILTLLKFVSQDSMQRKSCPIAQD